MNTPCWHVYLLACKDGTFYCGVTTDIVRRLAQHNGEAKGGARYTSGRRPVRLVAALSFASKSLAQKAEAAIKKLPRQKKLSYFSEEPSLCQDLK